MQNNNNFTLKNKEKQLDHIFTTERLIIRPITENDKALYCQLYCDKQVMQHIAKPIDNNRAGSIFNTCIKEMASSSPKVMTWVIIDKKNDSYVGIQGLNIKAQQNKTEAEMGIMLSSNNNGRSYAPEAVKGLINYSQQYLNIFHFYALCSHKNVAAQKVLKKLGFIFNETSTLSSKQLKAIWQPL